MKILKKSFLIWLLLIGVIHANVIPVPTSQPTIQAGIGVTLNSRLGCLESAVEKCFIRSIYLPISVGQ